MPTPRPPQGTTDGITEHVTGRITAGSTQPHDRRPVTNGHSPDRREAIREVVACGMAVAAASALGRPFRGPSAAVAQPAPPWTAAPTTQAALRQASTPTEQLAALGIRLPAPWTLPAGTPIPAEFVRVVGHRVVVSGHVPLDAGGRVVGPFGRVGADVPLGTAVEAARLAMLGALASVARELGSLDRVGRWVRVGGLVNAAPGFRAFPAVVNGASRLLLAVYGDAGRHARVAYGVAGLPFDAPVEIEAEAELADA